MSGISALLPDNDEFVARIQARLEVVENSLREVVKHHDNFVGEALSHLALAGGKRLRPVLTLITSELGPDSQSQDVIDAALAVELTHLASLYHDDVMDEAPLRRGVPTAQKVFGNTAAIMAGDVLFARASAIVSKLGPAAVLLHAKAFERLCVGELNEIAGVPAGVDPVAHYIQVLSDKTGSLIAASAEHGVMAAGGKPEYAQAVAAYGEKIGVAFQLADDVIDLVSDPEVTGKRPGTDLLENVDTMPTLLLRQAAKDGTIDDLGAEILAALDSGELTEGPSLEATVAKIRNHEVVAQTRELAEQWTNESLSELEVLPDGEVRDALATFAYAMVHRMA